MGFAPARLRWRLLEALHVRCLLKPQNPSRRRISVLQVHAARRSSSLASFSSSKEGINETLSSRDLLRSRIPRQLLRIAGVSFEGRQERIATLHPGQALAFEREPHNPHDKNAVAVCMLDGARLGYVPRDRTGAFLHSVCFGNVNSMGISEESGLWGASVDVQPELPPVTVLPIPRSLRGRLKLVEALENAGGTSSWEDAKRRTIARTHGQCYLTGAPASDVVEKWVPRPSDRVFKLAGFVLQAPLVTKIQHMFEHEEEYEELAAYLQRMNGWNREDAEDYLRHMKEIASDGDRIDSASVDDGWRVDLGVLSSMYIPVPDDFLPLCM